MCTKLKIYRFQLPNHHLMVTCFRLNAGTGYFGIINQFYLTK